MEAGPLSSELIIDNVKRFVPTKINNDERPDLVDLYRLADVPQILFFTGDGVLVLRAKDMKDLDTPEHLKAAMDRAMKLADDVHYQETALKLQTDNEPESPAAWKALGDFYNERLKYNAAIDAYATARDLVAGNDPEGAGEFMTFELMYMSLALRQYDASLAESAYYIKAYANSPKLDQAYLYRGYAFFYKKAYADARKTLEEQIKKFPKSPYNANAQDILDAIGRMSKG